MPKRRNVRQKGKHMNTIKNKKHIVRSKSGEKIVLNDDETFQEIHEILAKKASQKLKRPEGLASAPIEVIVDDGDDEADDDDGGEAKSSPRSGTTTIRATCASS